MLFSSPRFFVFLFVLMAVLAVPLDVKRKKHVLAVFSCLFYAAWDYRYLGLLLLVSVIDYACADRIHASNDAKKRKSWLVFSIVSNLAILAYFKYTNFFLENVNAIGGTKLPHLDILLPAGVSFYTFKSMSYTIDVYKKEIEPCKSWLDYATFVTFFPELIAGPIVRASVFLPQLDRPIGPSLARFRSGASTFLLGLTKKLVIADGISGVVDPVFADPGLYSPTTLWCIAFAYAIQIYADFSGYSDMAIGTARIIGYELPENFAMPYLSRSVTEFWRRWHITLSSWLRDYLYIPLGGNRGSTTRTYVNLALTMLLGGLWHGASWNFVLWGALHGGALAFHRAISNGGKKPPLPWFIAQPITLVFVVLCWVPFRAPTFGATWMFFKGMFGLGAGKVTFVPVAFVWIGSVVFAAHLLGLALERMAKSKNDDDSLAARVLGALDATLERHELAGWSIALGGRTIRGGFVIAAWILFVFFGAVLTNNPFIYFQF